MADRRYLTRQRSAVLDLLRQADDHPTAAEVMDRLRANGFNFAYATVYNAIHFLENEGLVKALHVGDGATRYDGRTDEHQHIVCTGCGRIAEVPDGIPAQWLQRIEGQTGYTVTDARILYEGRCPACRAGV